jgi:hypothetical protein
VSERTIKNASNRLRDPRGRYDYTRLAVLCACGHALGDHLALSPRACMKHGCACDLFRRLHTNKPARRTERIDPAVNMYRMDR